MFRIVEGIEGLYGIMLGDKVLASSLTEKEVAVLYAALKGDLEDGHIEIVGDGSQAVSYDLGTSISRQCAQSMSHDKGESIAGAFSQAVSYDFGRAQGGFESQAVCRTSGRSIGGDYSQVIGGRNSHVKGGTGSALVAMDGKGRNAVGIVGQKGIKPDTWYKAENGTLVRV